MAKQQCSPEAAATLLSSFHSIRPAQQVRVVGNFIFADEKCSDEVVLSDRRDSTGLSESCERRDWRIRDPTRRTTAPTWRKKTKVHEFFFAKNNCAISALAVARASWRSDPRKEGGGLCRKVCYAIQNDRKKSGHQYFLNHETCSSAGIVLAHIFPI